MKIDTLSGWATAPAAARLAGDEAYRFFDDPAAALAFIAKPARNADRQRRLRQRRRDNAIVLPPLAVPAVVVAAMIKAGRLNEQAALEPKQVEREAIDVLVEWSRPWSGNFP
jgi:hypothetical protein